MKNEKVYESMNSKKKIRLNGNESFKNIDKYKIDEIIEEISKENFNRYPNSENINLRKAYSKYCNVNYKNIIAGNGSDEMISLVISSNINKGDKVLTLNPDFSMYDYYVSLNEGELIKLNSRNDGSYNINDFIDIGKREEVKLIIFSNPNNPTGFSLCNDDIKKILDNFKNTLVLVDEAYFEYNSSTIIDEVKNYNNLLVTRTLSKAFGGAAIRVGFLIGSDELINKLNRLKVPYNVNSISQIIGAKIIDDIDSMRITVDETLTERERMIKVLKGLEEEQEGYIEFYRSNANYIFGRSLYKEIFLKHLDKNDIEIRNFKDDSFRITIGSVKENNLVLKVIKEFCNERSCYKERD
ncbi:MAG: pyridoxal phosphate-dependent aminotransferase [Clostridium sp.]|uniref:pyridoxal phosphate-dependent aminotransferase n=1 Tax=Clostridium sp. TaxID=1506 RepID=UPI003F391840